MNSHAAFTCGKKFQEMHNKFSHSSSSSCYCFIFLAAAVLVFVDLILLIAGLEPACMIRMCRVRNFIIMGQPLPAEVSSKCTTDSHTTTSSSVLVVVLYCLVGRNGWNKCACVEQEWMVVPVIYQYGCTPFTSKSLAEVHNKFSHSSCCFILFGLQE